MIVGENSRENDLDVNVTKEKKLTNIRAAGSDDALQLIPPKILDLEQGIEFIKEDELVEVTPSMLRVRKKVLESGKRPRHREST
jgi:GTP-binding protein